MVKTLISHSLVVILSFLGFLQESQAISKIAECRETRTSPNEIGVIVMIDSKNQYRLLVDSIASAPASPVHLEEAVTDSTPAATPGTASLKVNYKSAKVELVVSTSEGRTPDGDTGFLAKYRVVGGAVGSATPEIELACWFAKRASTLSSPR